MIESPGRCKRLQWISAWQNKSIVFVISLALKGIVQKTGVSAEFQDSVVLSIKTGYTVAYDRLPIHLAENRRDIPNRLFYADASFQIGDAQIYDVLATASERMRNQTAFQPYLRLHESLRLGQEPSSEGMWSIDRYKNLKILGDAQRRFPNHDWYITQDADSFFFWDTLTRWLQHFEPTEHHYFGRYSGGKG